MFIVCSRGCSCCSAHSCCWRLVHSVIVSRCLPMHVVVVIVVVGGRLCCQLLGPMVGRAGHEIKGIEKK